MKTGQLAICMIALASMAACGGGGDNGQSVAADPTPTPTPTPVPAPSPAYNIDAFFAPVIFRGASWTMTGHFNNGGQSESHVQEFNRAAAASGFTWRGLGTLKRNALKIDRTVNGVQGPSEYAYLYYDFDDNAFGSEGLVDRTAAWFRRTGTGRPSTAKIGETGTVATFELFADSSSRNPTNSRNRTWEMRRAGVQGNPAYCEKDVHMNPDGVYLWEYEWCYGMLESGNATGGVSYSYFVAGGNNGYLEGRNFSVGGDPITIPEPELNPEAWLVQPREQSLYCVRPNADAFNQRFSVANNALHSNGLLVGATRDTATVNVDETRSGWNATWPENISVHWLSDGRVMGAVRPGFFACGTAREPTDPLPIRTSETRCSTVFPDGIGQDWGRVEFQIVNGVIQGNGVDRLALLEPRLEFTATADGWLAYLPEGDGRNITTQYTASGLVTYFKNVSPLGSVFECR